MPAIAELRQIDGAMWARIPINGSEGRVSILSDAEIAANDQELEKAFAEIERLRAALRQVIGSCGDAAQWVSAARIAREALGDEQSPAPTKSEAQQVWEDSAKRIDDQNRREAAGEDVSGEIRQRLPGGSDW